MNSLVDFGVRGFPRDEDGDRVVSVAAGDDVTAPDHVDLSGVILVGAGRQATGSRDVLGCAETGDHHVGDEQGFEVEAGAAKRDLEWEAIALKVKVYYCTAGSSTTRTKIIE